LKIQGSLCCGISSLFKIKKDKKNLGNGGGRKMSLILKIP
jgi:hypothetical protein